MEVEKGIQTDTDAESSMLKCVHTCTQRHGHRHMTTLLEVNVTGLPQDRYSPALGIPGGLMQINISSVSMIRTSSKGCGFWLKWIPTMQFNSA